MRVLYPSAHHDRFIHSLGVFYLGKKAIFHLRKNIESKWHDRLSFTDEQWKYYEFNFILACLLHDCGHSPFSHTLEDNYARDNALSEQLASLAGDQLFSKDFSSCSPAPHEKTSAILVLKVFKDVLQKECYGCNPILIIRMILGCIHHTFTRDNMSLSLEEKFENCLVQLLNGNAVDVDKLDYILRDTWASGVDNVKVDIERLLSALSVAEIGGIFPKLVFGGKALSVLQSAVDARNYLYRWVYSHHKVIYDVELLRRSVEHLGVLLTSQPTPVSFINEVFSVKSFLEIVSIGGFKFFLPTDGDFIYLLKLHLSEISEAREWLSRDHSRVALWKNFAEFENIFKSVSERDRKLIFNQRKDLCLSYCRTKNLDENSFMVLDAPTKIVVIEKNQLFIDINNQAVPYTEIFGEKKDNMPTYFLVYGPRSFLNNETRADFISFLVTQH